VTKPRIISFEVRNVVEGDRRCEIPLGNIINRNAFAWRSARVRVTNPRTQGLNYELPHTEADWSALKETGGVLSSHGYVTYRILRLADALETTAGSLLDNVQRRRH